MGRAKATQQIDPQLLTQLLSNSRIRINGTASGPGPGWLYWIRNKQGIPCQFAWNRVQQFLMDFMWYANIIPKSRQHGITTAILIYILDQCLFVPGLECALIAHRMEDAQKFITRIRWVYQNMFGGPDASEPQLQARKAFHECHKLKVDNAKELSFTHPNGQLSSIYAGTMVRGQTVQILHISELGWLSRFDPQRAREVLSASENALHAGSMYFIESTSHGPVGEFWELCEIARKKQAAGETLTPLDKKLFFFGWFLDPQNRLAPEYISSVKITTSDHEYFKAIEDGEPNILDGGKITIDDGQRAWYVNKETNLKRDGKFDAMKQEHPSTYKEAFEAKVTGYYYAKQLQQMKDTGKICKVPWNNLEYVETWWDLGNDMTCIWFTQNSGREIHVINYYENSNVADGMFHYIAMLRQLKYRYLRHTAPWDIAQRCSVSAKSRFTTALEMGIRFRPINKASLADGIDACRRTLAICVFDEENCRIGLGHLRQYSRRFNQQLDMFVDDELHDEHSHAAAAFRTLAMGHEFHRPQAAEQQPVNWAGWI